MTILFITIAWPAPGERNLYTDQMEEFVRNGHTVYVVGTTDPGHHEDEKLAVENGVNVLRVNSGRIRKTSHLRKGLSLLTLDRKIFKAVHRNLSDKTFDLILGSTPPVTLSSLYIKLKKRFNAPFYLLLKDIWPQGSVDLKVLKKYSIPWLWLRSNEIRLYKSSDFIGCMSPAGVDYICSRNSFIDRSKVEVCPNCISPSQQIINRDVAAIRSAYNIPLDACVFLFSGNLGLGHGLGFLVSAIKHLSYYRKAFFVIGGSGTHHRFLDEKLKEFPHDNVLLNGWLSRDDFNNLLAAVDVGLILLHRYTVPQFPSRLLSYLDYSKPVLCAANDNTDLGENIVKNNFGVSVDHGNIEKFTEAVRFFSENHERREEMGKNGREYLLNNYTMNHGYKIITDHFKHQTNYHSL